MGIISIFFLAVIKGYFVTVTHAVLNMTLMAHLGHDAVLPCRVPLYRDMLTTKDGLLTIGTTVLQYLRQLTVVRPSPSEWNLRIHKVSSLLEDTYTCETNHREVLVSVKLIIKSNKDSHEDSHEEHFRDLFKNEMRERMIEQRQHLDGKLAEVTDTIEAKLGSKLDHIADVAEKIERRQRKFKLAQVCTGGICGDSGICDLSEDEETYVCHCDEGHVGKHCEVSCTEGLCGDYGTCGLLEDEGTYVCHCDEVHAGKNCEITGLCKIRQYQVDQLPPMPGRPYPNCADDGSYAGVQYSGSQAICVTPENEEIGYSVNIGEAEDMNCQCARDEYFSEEEGTNLNCLSNGNYP